MSEVKKKGQWGISVLSLAGSFFFFFFKHSNKRLLTKQPMRPRACFQFGAHVQGKALGCGCCKLLLPFFNRSKAVALN